MGWFCRNAGLALANNGETLTNNVEGNTVGSLTERQKAIIIGSFLGDGSMRCKTHALVEINHAASQKEYVDWKFNELREFVSTPPKVRRGNAGRIAYRLTTRSLPVFTGIYKRFYRDGHKMIPKELELHPLTLAVWFMDDGCKSYNAVYLNTQQFSITEQKQLRKMLKEQHDINATLNRDKSYYRLRIAVNSVGRLKKLIKPYLLPIFWYKFPKTP